MPTQLPIVRLSHGWYVLLNALIQVDQGVNYHESVSYYTVW